MADAALSFPRFRSRLPWWGRDLQTLRNHILSIESSLQNRTSPKTPTSKPSQITNLDRHPVATRNLDRWKKLKS